MSDLRDQPDFSLSPELEAGGDYADGHWSLWGVIPASAVRVELHTPTGEVYLAHCHEDRWDVRLVGCELNETAIVRAIAADGSIVASQHCLLRVPDPPMGLAGRVRRLLRHHTSRAGRGWITYGPN